MRRPIIFIAMACAAALLAPAAHASSKQLTVMQDDALVYRNGPEVRERTLDEFKALGADVVKIQVYWNEIAPRGRRKPSGFDATSPGAYDFSLYDATVREIVERGMRPLLSLGNRAPDWATARVTRQRGTYRPSAREFGRFVRAVGTRYSGSYGSLPRVTLWSLWNEPNIPGWLLPQRHAPAIYRALYLAGHKALRATGHGRDRILFGELAPRGGKGKTRPLEFLRKAACLERSYRGCRGVGRIPMSGVAIHPYTFGDGPLARTTHRDDLHVGAMRGLTRLMDALARRGRIPRRSPLWITEFGFQTDPPDTFGSKLSRTPGYMDMSEWLAFKSPRVRSVAQYTLEDEPPRDSSNPVTRWSSWQSGLKFADGRKKRGVYNAFRMPVYVRTPDITRVTVFGGLRTASGGSAKIESKTKGSGYRELGSASLNRAGYFSKTFRIKNSHKRTYRITIDGRSRVKRPVSR